MINVTCFFGFEGKSLDFAQISAVTGVELATTRRASQTPRLGVVPKDSWYVEVEDWGRSLVGVGSNPITTWPTVAGPLSRVLSLVSGREDQIAEYCRHRHIDVLLVVVIGSTDNQLPILDIPTSLIALAARLGACITFDPYLKYGRKYGKKECPELWLQEQ